MKALIAADLAPEKIGSLECQIFTVGRLLEARGINVRYAFAGGISRAVLLHFNLDPGAVTTDLGTLDQSLSRSKWLAHVSAIRPDVLWLHFFPHNSAFTYKLRRACPKARITLTEHVSRGANKRGLAKAAVCLMRDTVMTRFIDQYVGVSRFTSQRLAEFDHVPPKRIRTIYNGIDLTRFRAQEQPGTYIAAVCYMRKEKGVGVLLQALKILRANGCQPRCLLAGVGPELDGYKDFVRKENLENVQFIGLRDDVPAIMHGAALTVSPSLWPEAFGLAAAEAMAAGVPVIASNIGALPEVVEHGVTGRLIPPGDVTALSREIESLLKKPLERNRMGRAARERVLKLFNLDERAGEIAGTLLATA